MNEKIRWRIEGATRSIVAEVVFSLDEVDNAPAGTGVMDQVHDKIVSRLADDLYPEVKKKIQAEDLVQGVIKESCSIMAKRVVGAVVAGLPPEKEDSGFRGEPSGGTEKAG